MQSHFHVGKNNGDVVDEDGIEDEDNIEEEDLFDVPPSLVYRRKVYRDSQTTEECDLRPTNKQPTFEWINKMTPDERATIVVELPDQLKILPPPGLTAIKANEMQNKIGPLAPEDKRQYFQRLTPELEAQVTANKQGKNKKIREAAAAKKKRIEDANK
mmetsp:Transcript_31033/g.52615  ORF Transcript_31033/g.52615 Transcript_31033/m.52615 type:complete len:158 (-) Transcript_31033:124-597(-)